MREILIFAGTTEGRKLSEHLEAAGVGHVVCVATEYGETVLSPGPFVRVHRGRMGSEEIREFIQKGNFAAVVDATHPYAENITGNIKEAMEGTKVPRFRMKREKDERDGCRQVLYFDDSRSCAKALEGTGGNILLTTGSKELEIYCSSEDVRRRLYVRVLPAAESILECTRQGISGKQIIAMQGPFSEEMNEALIRQYRISCLVTKDSGRPGGFKEKLDAAKRTGIQVYVTGRPGTDEEGISFPEVCRELEKICGTKIETRENDGFSEIILAGAGMGGEGCLTEEVRKAISMADVLMGAERLLDLSGSGIEKQPFYQAKQIIPYLRKNPGKKAVILFSGDSGFCSGCASLEKALRREIRENGLKASLRVMPGISSVAYLASCVGESYEDAAVCSMHGKKLNNLVRRIKNSRKMFLLTSGVRDVNRLGRLLEEAGMGNCRITAGYRLSYEDQEIRVCTPRQCGELTAEGLYTCFIENPDAEERKITHGISDSEFIRDRVPMTKEEVREVSICKLKLHGNAVVYDIGSGTGSVAVEIAALSHDIQVYALERKREAADLIRKNMEKFELDNITVTETEAPEGFADLPAATHAFIGGSGGKMKEILDELQRINDRMQVVINAVTLETICELREILCRYKVENEEILQLQANRTRQAGRYHLMQAENPVWICSFCFAGQVQGGRAQVSLPGLTLRQAGKI